MDKKLAEVWLDDNLLGTVLLSEEEAHHFGIAPNVAAKCALTPEKLTEFHLNGDEYVFIMVLDFGNNGPTVKCQRCDTEIQIIEGMGFVECSKCGRDHDVCPRCRQRLVEVDDYGVALCQKCFDQDKKAQRVIAHGVEKENFFFGLND